jgi:hypothetical protein
MARARNWERLSDGTRKRYERAGVSRSDYLSGMPLKKARGHHRTPEHPDRSPKAGQEQYYVNKIVERAFSHNIKYAGPQDVHNPPVGQEPPTIDQIEYALELSDAELSLLAASPEWWWLRYH